MNLKNEKVVVLLLFLGLVSVCSPTLLALMGRYLMSFSFLTTRHKTLFFDYYTILLERFFLHPL